MHWVFPRSQRESSGSGAKGAGAAQRGGHSQAGGAERTGSYKHRAEPEADQPLQTGSWNEVGPDSHDTLCRDLDPENSSRQDRAPTQGGKGAGLGRQEQIDPIVIKVLIKCVSKCVISMCA